MPCGRIETNPVTKETNPITNRRQKYESSESKVNNFILLEPSLRLLGIKFDAQVAYHIMQAKPGVATQLLYQVRLHCYFVQCVDKWSHHRFG